MGIYFNPSNASFRQARNSMVYVDKTNLLNFLNRRLFTDDKCIALSHARRFGKSHAAGMIDAYYSRGTIPFIKNDNKWNIGNFIN